MIHFFKYTLNTFFTYKYNLLIYTQKQILNEELQPDHGVNTSQKTYSTEFSTSDSTSAISFRSWKICRITWKKLYLLLYSALMLSAREGHSACKYGNLRQHIKSLKMIVKNSDGSPFFYFHALNTQLKLTQLD